MGTAGAVKNLLKNLFRAAGVELRGYAPDFDPSCVSLTATPGVPTRGNVLLSYILAPFLLKRGQAISVAHNNHLESVLIARTFQDLGYAVDIIDFRNDEFIPRKNYAFFVSARTHLETIAARLNSDCIKIAHLDTSHFAFNNFASYSRLLALQQRRGITLPVGMRLIEQNRAIELADYGVVLGNGRTVDTYRYAKKPLFALPVPAIVDQEWDANKDFHASRNRSLWLGSAGFVHKGLDLVLEAFAGMTEMHLTICGPIQSDPDFRQAYYKELFETANILTAGWLDITGDEFRRHAHQAAAVVYPSCAEGQATSVVNCLRAGLIPVVTAESGMDVGDFGIVLTEPSVGAIQGAVNRLARLPPSQLKEMSRKASEYAHEHHSAENYVRTYRGVITEILEARGVTPP